MEAWFHNHYQKTESTKIQYNETFKNSCLADIHEPKHTFFSQKCSHDNFKKNLKEKHEIIDNINYTVFNDKYHGN